MNLLQGENETLVDCSIKLKMLKADVETYSFQPNNKVIKI